MLLDLLVQTVNDSCMKVIRPDGNVAVQFENALSDNCGRLIWRLVTSQTDE